MRILDVMTKLTCKNCRNAEKFIAKYLYSCLVDGQGNKLDKKEMDDEPEYQCEKCGSTDIEIDFRQ